MDFYFSIPSCKVTCFVEASNKNEALSIIASDYGVAKKEIMVTGKVKTARVTKG
jgi:hypothetical protein